MVWIETPTNPLLKLVDIQGASEIVHQHEVSVPHMEENGFDALPLNNAMLTLGKVSRPEAESADCTKTRVFFESVQCTQSF